MQIFGPTTSSFLSLLKARFQQLQPIPVVTGISGRVAPWTPGLWSVVLIVIGCGVCLADNEYVTRDPDPADSAIIEDDFFDLVSDPLAFLGTLMNGDLDGSGAIKTPPSGHSTMDGNVTDGTPSIDGVVTADEDNKEPMGSPFELTPQDVRRQKQIDRCLSIFFRLPVDTELWRPWTIMHGLLPYGQQSAVMYRGKRYRAVDYLCQNGIGNDMKLLSTLNNGLHVMVGPGVQGHEGQFLAMLAQSDVPLTQPILVNGQTFTVADLVEYEKQGCRQNTELTFKLIGLSHYTDSNLIWQNSIGQSWNIERLIFEEIKQPINGAACGGTHRLMGLSYAVNRRAAEGKPIDGQWARAQNFTKQYQDLALRFQNSDGSFSTNWFLTQESDSDSRKRLYTTGHIAEWLAFSLPTERLNEPKLQLSIDYLMQLMLNSTALDLEYGPRGHALHALRVYEIRYFGMNSDVERIAPADLAMADKALKQQKQMKPSFDFPGSVPAQGVSYPGRGPTNFGTGGPRGFRRR